MRMQNSYDIAQTRKREGDIDLVPFEGQAATGHSTVLPQSSIFGGPTNWAMAAGQSNQESHIGQSNKMSSG